MPAAILPILLTLGSGFAASSLSGGSGSSSSSSAQAAATQQAQTDADKQAKADAAIKAAALRRSAPDAQAQTGGSLTDAPFASLTQSIAGEPGNIQEALRALGMNQDSTATQQPGLSFSGGS